MGDLRTRRVFIGILNLSLLWTTLGATCSRAVTLKHPLPQLTQIDPNTLPLFLFEGDLKALKKAVSEQIKACSAQPSSHFLKLSDRSVSQAVWCVKTLNLVKKWISESQTPDDLWKKAKAGLTWYAPLSVQNQVLFTGYYFPRYNGSLKPDATHTVPLYARPPELVATQVNGRTVWMLQNADGSFHSYHTREEIDEKGALAGRGLELAWLSDPLDAFILHVQGSGVVHSKNGKRMILNYAGKTDHAYRSLRSILKSQGVADEFLTLPGFRSYFKAHPEALRPVLSQNPSYVFFKKSKKGPYGASGQILTPRHSIAADPEHYPYGSFLFIHSQRPHFQNQKITKWSEMNRLVIVQDTGGAIKGPDHIDFYLGEGGQGDEVELTAGTKQDLGSLYIGVAP